MGVVSGWQTTQNSQTSNPHFITNQPQMSSAAIPRPPPNVIICPPKYDTDNKQSIRYAPAKYKHPSSWMYMQWSAIIIITIGVRALQ